MRRVCRLIPLTSSRTTLSCLSQEPTREPLQNWIIPIFFWANQLSCRCSGLGYSTCQRLIDEFAKNFPNTHKLTLVITTRRPAAQVRSLKNEFHQYALRLGSQVAERIRILAETLDLLNLSSVRALSQRLNRNFPKLDAIILNAGIGGWSGLNWPKAIWSVSTDMIHATTWPSYKLGYVGMVVPKQTQQAEEKPLGSVFCSNVFGHYMLAHNVMPLLRRSGQPNGPGRVVWLSSIESTINFFNADDIQGLKSNASYESSKALTDVLALTSDLPSTAPWVKSFLSTTESDDEDSSKPSPINYVGHPGICGTAIVPLLLPLFYLMIVAFYFARWLGSPWHPNSPYLGANAPVWLALSPQSTLDAAEKPYRDQGGGRVKWGSSTDIFGTPIVASTETDGWGFGGMVGGAVLAADKARRRKRGMKVATAEDRLQFEELGRRCWQYMEELRVEWETLLEREENGDS
jgi:3-keto steroid reductase